MTAKTRVSSKDYQTVEEYADAIVDLVTSYPDRRLTVWATPDGEEEPVAWFLPEKPYTHDRICYVIETLIKEVEHWRRRHEK